MLVVLVVGAARWLDGLVSVLAAVITTLVVAGVFVAIYSRAGSVFG